MFDFLGLVILGAIAGWAAGRLFFKNNNFGTFGNMLIGVLGAVLGVFFLAFLGGILAKLVLAFIGAVILFWVIGKIGKEKKDPV